MIIMGVMMGLGMGLLYLSVVTALGLKLSGGCMEALVMLCPVLWMSLPSTPPFKTRATQL